MKPRLKLLAGRRLAVIVAGTRGLNESEVRREVIGQYGSLQSFATTWGYRYGHVTSSFHPTARTRAGEAHQIRLVLGLPTSPTPASEAQVAAQERRRHGREPEWVFGMPEARA